MQQQSSPLFGGSRDASRGRQSERETERQPDRETSGHGREEAVAAAADAADTSGTESREEQQEIWMIADRDSERERERDVHSEQGHTQA